MTGPRSVAATLILAMTATVALGASPPPEGGQPAGASSAEARLLVDVPYIAQSEKLCGGAALAMVLRFLGARPVHAEDFAALINEAGNGIETGALEGAAASRGYHPVAFNGTLADLAHHVARGRPVVVLIRDSPSQFHYVVMVGILGRRVVFHDPARAPFRRMDASRFDALWAASGRWALIVLPGARDPGTPDAPAPLTPAPPRAAEPRSPQTAEMIPLAEACADLVARGVQAAHENRIAYAERTLGQAIADCPADAAPAREMAGLRLTQTRWRDAQDLAARAVTLDPADGYAWNLLAAARYLDGDRDGALAAWNATGTPRVDLVRIDGLDRLPYRTVADPVAAVPGSMLTPRALRLARRRLDALPAVQSASLAFEPGPRGLADLHARVVERPLFDRSIGALAQAAGRAVFDREIVARVANPAGRGEVWRANWRWWPERPRAGVALSVPRPSGLPGVWTVDGSWERRTFDGSGAAGTAPATLREERRHGSIGVDDWIHPALRVAARAGLDRWVGRGLTYSVGGGPDVRAFGDRGALKLDAEWWLGESRFSRTALDSAWRLTTEETRPIQTFFRVGFQAASRDAPRILWPGAGSSHGQALLRAHHLLDGGVVSGDAFGRQIAYASIEAQRWRSTARLVRVGAAAFVDAARVWMHDGSPGSRLLVDAGVGVRLGVAGSRTHLRVDLARSLTDGGATVSAGWVMPWPGWER